jgi:hypothetical protein
MTIDENVLGMFANNHYAGHGPATVEMFRGLWNVASGGDRTPAPKAVSGRLFE